MTRVAHLQARDGGTGGADPLLAPRIVEFVRLARANDFRVGIPEAIDALQIAERLDIADPCALRWGLRTLLCSNAQDWMRFETLFDHYWQPRKGGGIQIKTSGALPKALPAGPAPASVPNALHDARRESETHDSAVRVGASRKELTSSSDFRLAQLNQDTRPLERWIETLARRMRRRLLRRHWACSRGHRIHLRRTVRHSLRYGGLPLDLVHQQRRRELPRLVLITDVSRSMNVYSYFFLHFARGIIDAFDHADAFLFHTRLIHVTDALREPDGHRRKDKMAWMAAGWGGGTRIGECLQSFNRDYARRLVDSRTFVFIVSDGYDTGEAALLAEQVRRLRQRARRVIWLNPLLGRDDYEPTAGGMAAALPHLDRFASAHNLESLMKIEGMLVSL